MYLNVFFSSREIPGLLSPLFELLYLYINVVYLLCILEFGEPLPEFANEISHYRSRNAVSSPTGVEHNRYDSKHAYVEHKALRHLIMDSDLIDEPLSATCHRLLFRQPNSFGTLPPPPPPPPPFRPDENRDDGHLGDVDSSSMTSMVDSNSESSESGSDRCNEEDVAANSNGRAHLTLSEVTRQFYATKTEDDRTLKPSFLRNNNRKKTESGQFTNFKTMTNDRQTLYRFSIGKKN